MKSKDKSKKVKYVGPSKEELAQKQSEMDQRISLMQERNKTLQSDYDRMRLDSERTLSERSSLMDSELERQKRAYEEILGRQRASLEESQLAQEKQKGLLSDLTERQTQFSRLQSATTEKESQQARDLMSLNRRSAQVNTMGRSNQMKRRRRFLSTIQTQPQT